ncbi:MAG: biotin/lipoyl-binding protein [Bacteroidetes bacterium]|nr:biotin/lipoyl-binding protein [Bacteroidota bacterium]
MNQFTTKSGHFTFNIDQTENHYSIDGKNVEFDCIKISDNRYHLLVDNRSLEAELISIDYNKKVVDLMIENRKISIQVEDAFDRLLVSMGIDKGAKQKVSEIKAPMPGLVLSVAVSEGDTVEEGSALLILEAMKMENVLTSPSDVVIKEIKVKPGDKVDKNQTLIVFE